MVIYHGYEPVIINQLQNEVEGSAKSAGSTNKSL